MSLIANWAQLSTACYIKNPIEAVIGIIQVKKSSIFTFFLMLAFVAGASGNVLAAAFCPHLGSPRACCLKQASHSPPSSNEMYDRDMRDMQMGDMQLDMPAESTEEASPRQVVSTEVEPDRDGSALELPAETCAHCLNHSQLPLGSFALRETESAKRCADLTAPQVIQQVSFATLPSLILEPREHAPPGEPSPRHILINVFRI